MAQTQLRRKTRAVSPDVELAYQVRKVMIPFWSDEAQVAVLGFIDHVLDAEESGNKLEVQRLKDAYSI